MSKQLKILESFVEKGNFGEGEIVLSPGMTIVDKKKFAESHLRALKGNRGNKTMLPYYERLIQFCELPTGQRPVGLQGSKPSLTRTTTAVFCFK